MADGYPQEALDMLQKSPDTWKQFQDTFGSLPDGFDPPRPSDPATTAAVGESMKAITPTTLDAAGETGYRSWLQQNGMTKDKGYNVDDNFTGTDYDLRGYYKKYGPTPTMADMSKGIKPKHLTDEFKLPNHKTFSDQSIYAKGDAYKLAGQWKNGSYVPPAPKEAIDYLGAHPESRQQFVDTFGYDPTPPPASPTPEYNAWDHPADISRFRQGGAPHPQRPDDSTKPSDIGYGFLATSEHILGGLPQIPAAIARFNVNPLGNTRGMEENALELGAAGYHWLKQFTGLEPKPAKPVDPNAASEAEAALGMEVEKPTEFTGPDGKPLPKINPPKDGEPQKGASTFFPEWSLRTTAEERKAGENVTRAFKPFSEKMEDYRRDALSQLTPDYLTATMGAIDWKNPTSLLAKAVDFSPYVLANAGIGGAVAKLAATSKLTELATVAMPQSMKIAAAEAAAKKAVTWAGTVANGGMMGSGVAQDVSDAVNQMPEEDKMKFEEYRIMRLHGATEAYATQQLAADRAHASLLAGIVGGGIGGEFMGPILSKVAIARRVPGSKIFSNGAAALGMGIDTLASGAAQGAAMKVGENIGLKPNKDGLWDGVGDQALAFAMLNMAMTGTHVAWHGLTAKGLAQPIPSVADIAAREKAEAAKASADKEVDAASRAEGERLATENARVKRERLQVARQKFLEANEAVNQITTAANDPHQAISYNQYERAHNQRLDAFNEFREAAEDAGLVQPKGEKSGESKTEGSDRAPSVGQVPGRGDLNGETGGGLRSDQRHSDEDRPEGGEDATLPAPSERDAGQLLKPLTPEEGPLEPDERPVAVAAGKPKITPKSVPSEEVGPIVAGKPHITLKTQKPITDKDYAANYAAIPSNDTLTPSKKRVENKMRAIVADVPSATAAYAKLPDSDGGRVINTDTVRELSPDYNKDNIARSIHADSVQEPSSWLADRLYEQRLAKPVADGKEPVVLFTAGGSDSGKSVSLGSEDGKSADIVYDGNMNTLQKARRRIRMALDSGREVHIQFTHRDPIAAFRDGVLPRAMKFGRTVPVEAHASTHNGSFKTVMTIAKQYAGDERVKISVIDTAAGKETTLKAVAEKHYDVTPEQLHKIAEEEYKNGRITEAVFRGVSGKRAERMVGSGKDNGQLPREQVGGADRSASTQAAGQSEEGHPRGEGGDRGQPQEKAGLGKSVSGTVQVKDLQRSSAIMSAERSNLSPAENAKRTEALDKKLTEAGLDHQKAQGVYKGGSEGSFVVHARNPEDHAKVRELGKEFNQESTPHTVNGESRLHFDDHAEAIGNLREASKEDAESRDNYTKLDDGRYLVTDTKEPSYRVASKPERIGRPLEFRHFSNLKDDEVTLDPSKRGTGMKGEEARRGGPDVISLYGKNHPDNLVDGNLRQGTEYVVRVPASKMYDLSKDPNGFLDKHDSFNAVENAIKKAGFLGYHLPKGEGIFKGQGRLFGKTRAVKKGVSLSAPGERAAGFWNIGKPTGQMERRGGMPPREFEQALGQVKTELPGLNIRVLEHPAEIPGISTWDAEHLPIQAVFQERANGNYQIYLVRPHLRSAEDVRNAIYHEGVGHMGVRFLLSRNGTYESTMNQIWKQHEPLVRKFKISETTSKNLDSTDPMIREAARQHAAEELFAHAAGARQDQKQGVFQKIVSIVRDALRKVGLLKNFSEQDIARIIDRARDYVVTGKSKRDAMADYTSIAITGSPARRLEDKQSSFKAGKSVRDEVRNARTEARSQPSFSAGAENSAENKEPIWHSALIRSVEALPQKSATAEQWMKTIDNLTSKGVKKTEIEWMGIHDALSRHWSSKDVGDPLKRKISKDDLLRVMNASRLQLSERELSGSATREYSFGEWEQEEPDQEYLKERAEEDFKSQFPSEGDFEENGGSPSKKDWMQDQMHELTRQHYEDPEVPMSRGITVTSGDEEAGFTHSQAYGEHTLYSHSSNENIAISEGPRNRIDDPRIQALIDQHLDEHWGRNEDAGQYEDYTLPGGSNYRELLMTMPQDERYTKTMGSYVGSHFDEPNIIAHLRLKDRTVDGKKMLFAEEIQSDWHQEGREKGYFPDPEMEAKIAELEAQVDEHMANFPEKERGARGNERLDLEATKQLAELRAQQRLAKRSRVPDAPHKTSWPELALKRLIRYASDNGYDKIGWTTGDQQNERYGLSKKAKHVHAWKTSEGAYHVEGHNEDLGLRPGRLMKDDFKKEDLPGLLGQELADRVIKDIDSGQTGKRHVYQDINAEFGGAGMRGFYDKMLPNIAHKLTKKYGGAVGVSEIPGYRDSNPRYAAASGTSGKTIIHSMDLNPQIVEASRSGPLSSSFSAGSPEMQSFLDKINPKPRPWAERMTGFVKSLKHEFAERVFDDFYGIEKAFREGGKKGSNLGFMSAHLSRNDGELMSVVVEKGQPIWTDGAPAVKADTVGLEDILKPLGGKADDFFRAMVARRAQRLMSEGREHLFTHDEIQAGMKLWDQNPDFERAFTELAKLKRGILDFAQEAGVINPDNRLMWEHDDYIPFYRLMNQTGDVLGVGAGGALGKVKAQIRRLKGGQAALGDPLENLLQNWHSLIKASLKNKAAQLTIESLIDTGIVTKVNAPNSSTMTKEAFKAKAAELGVDTDKIPRQAWDQLYSASAHIPEDPNTVHVWNNGQKDHYAISDPYLYRALASMNQNGKSAFVEMAKSILALPKRAITFGITRSPVFPLKNLARDMLSLFVTGDAARHQLAPAFIPVWDSVKGAYKYMKGGQEVSDLAAAGGLFDAGYAYGSPSKVSRRLKIDLNKSATGKVIHGAAIGARLYVHLIDASESAHRLAVAQGVRNAGKGRIEQAYAARDVLNFSSGGSNDLLKFMMSTVPFLKAGLSGLYMTGRRIHQNPSGVLLRGSIMALASVAYAYLHKDDQRYKDLPPDQKTNYWHFFDVVNQGDHWKLPKPFEIGALFATVPEAVTDAMLSDEPDRVKQGAGQVGNALANAITYSMLPVGVAPFYDIATNKQSYSGAPILTQADQQVLPIAQDAPYVSPTYRFLAQNAPQSFPVWTQSPKQLQYVARGFTGTLGDYVTAMTDILVRKATGQSSPAGRGPIQDLPAVNQVMVTGQPRRTKQSDAMYAIANQIAQDYATAKKILATDPDKVGDFMDAHAEEMAVKDVFEGATARVSALKKAQVQVQQANDMTPQEKQELIDQFQEEINDIAEKSYEYRPGGKLNPETISKLTGKNIDQKANILTQSGMPATAALLRSWPQGLAA